VLVHPRDEIMIQSAERKTTTVKSDVDSRIPSAVPLSCAQGSPRVPPARRRAPREGTDDRRRRRRPRHANGSRDGAL
jgi:hypothetical protein